MQTKPSHCLFTQTDLGVIPVGILMELLFQFITPNNARAIKRDIQVCSRDDATNHEAAGYCG